LGVVVVVSALLLVAPVKLASHPISHLALLLRFATWPLPFERDSCLCERLPTHQSIESVNEPIVLEGKEHHRNLQSRLGVIATIQEKVQ